MTESDPVAALAARAISIAESAVTTQAAIVGQQAKSKRTTRWLAVSLAVDIALSLGIGWLTLGQASTSASIHRSQLNACAIGNSFRAAQVKLWDHVIAVSAAPPHETAAEREQRLAKLAAFRAYVAAQFKPVKCAALYGKT